MKRLIVDSGYMVALFHERDFFHRAAMKLEAELGDAYQLVSTIFVVQEICHLLLERVGNHMVLEFMDCMCSGAIQLPPLPDQWIHKATAILHKYSDRKLQLADASIVVLADHLGIGDVASVDYKDFEILRWGNGKKAFNNHLIPV